MAATGMTGRRTMGRAAAGFASALMLGRMQMQMQTLATCIAMPTFGSPRPVINVLGLPAGVSSNLNCNAYQVSADGLVVVGAAPIPGNILPHATQWNAAGQAQTLAGLPVNAPSYALCVSADGGVIGGYVKTPGFVQQGFRWSADKGLTLLGALPGANESYCFGMSADGEVLAGRSSLAGGGIRAIRWTSAGGMEDLGTLPGGTTSTAGDISADGTVIVGASNGPGKSLHPFRWTQREGMQDLGLLPGDESALASAISPDGSAIVGTCYSPTQGDHVFRWRLRDGMQDLGSAPKGANVVLYAMSSDGSLMAGADVDEFVAYLWTAQRGFRDLNELLPEIGVDLTGWTLEIVEGVSADGSVMVGQGTYNGVGRGWKITGLRLTACAADTNIDGTVNNDDLVAVIGDWGVCAACAADIAPAGGDGAVNIDDLLAVINAWGACP